MQFENFDNKIRQAAEQHHPEYDGKAWTNMEKLLDRHLPQKEDRRRRVIFFLLLFLLLGGGAWIIISKPWQPGNQTLTTTTGNAEKKSPNTPIEQATPSNSPAGKTSVESTNKQPDQDGHTRIQQTVPVEVKTTPVRDVVIKAGR